MEILFSPSMQSVSKKKGGGPSPPPPTSSSLVHMVSPSTSKELKGGSSSPSPSRGTTAAVPENGKSWASLLQSSSSKGTNFDLYFVQPELVGDRKMAIFNDEDFSEPEEFLKNSLIACIVGFRPAYKPLLSYIQMRWAPKGEVALHILNNGFFLVHFSLEEDLSRVFKGFWTLKGHPIVVQRWSEGISLEKLTLQELPIWVEFPNLPFHMWSPSSLSKLGSMIGLPLYMDVSTGRRSRLSNPRICVRVKADSKLPEEVFCKAKDGEVLCFSVSYPWKPLVCETCNSFGHASASCATKGKGKEKGMTAASLKSVMDEKKGYRVKNKTLGQEVSTANTFSVLQDINEWDQSSSGLHGGEVAAAPTPRVSEEEDNSKIASILNSKSVPNSLGKNLNLIPQSELEGALVPSLQPILETTPFNADPPPFIDSVGPSLKRGIESPSWLLCALERGGQQGFQIQRNLKTN